MPKVLVLLDGIGDLPCIELLKRTPLEAAKTPNLDLLTRHGSLGYVYPISSKIAPESDVGVTAVLGYDPYKYYTGRGPLESIGAEIKLPRDFIALRANFATVINGKLVDRRVGRTLKSKEAKELALAINNKVKLKHPFIFKATSSHRAVLIIKGIFSDKISNADPAYQKEGSFGIAKEEFDNKAITCSPLDSKQLSKETAELINDFIQESQAVLSNHEVNKKRIKKELLPANFILLRDAGIAVPEFPKKQNWAAIVGMPLEEGIAKLSGMEILKIKYPEVKHNDLLKYQLKCLKTEIKYAKKYIKKNKFNNYYLHIKQTDIPGHDGKPLEKVKMIEYLDKKLFKFLRKIKNLELIVTGDHSTPCRLKAHSADPVPLLYYGGEKDETRRFTEKESKKGSLGEMLGKEVLTKLKF